MSLSSATPTDIAAHTTFDDLLASSQMPPPGLDYFRARRGLWLTPRSSETWRSSKSDISSAHEQLVEILQTPGAVMSDSCWKNGIQKVWDGLSKGARLKHGLPLGLAIKVVQASWVQDDIWPADLQAPESDNELLEELLSEPAVLQNSKEPKHHTETSKNAATLLCD